MLPRLAEVAADLVAVGGDSALEPLDAAHRSALAREARKDATPARLPRLLLGAIKQAKGRHPHSKDGGVRLRPYILDHTDGLTAERSGKQFEADRSVGQSDGWLRPSRLVYVGTRRRSFGELQLPTV